MSKKRTLTWRLKPKKEWKIIKGKKIPEDLVEVYPGRDISNFDETGKVKLSYDEQYYIPAERTEIDWSDGLAPQETGPCNPKVKRDHYYQQLHNRSCKTREERAADERKKKLQRLITERKQTEEKTARIEREIKKLKEQNTPRKSPCQGCAIMGGRTRKRKRKSKRRKSKVKRRRKSKRRKSKVKRRRKRRKSKRR